MNAPVGLSADNLSPVRKPMFGDAFIEETYREAQERASELGIFRVYKFEVVNDEKILTLCNFWRYVKRVNGNIITQEFCLTTNTWRAVPHKRIPNVILLPFTGYLVKNLWAELLQSVISRLMTHTYKVKLLSAKDISGSGDRKDRLDLATKVFIKHVIGNYDPEEGGPLPKRLDHDGLSSACNGIRACLWDHFIDREVLTACLRIDRLNLSLEAYLKYHSKRKHVLRISRERPNLLPFLQLIKPSYWHDPSLFSKKYWVSDSGVAPIDGMLKKQSNTASFEDARTWSWVTKSSLLITKQVAEHMSSRQKASAVIFPMLAEIAASINVEKIPVAAWAHLIYSLLRVYRHALYRAECSVTDMSIVSRCFLIECAKVWHRDGYKVFRQKLKHDEVLSLEDMFDFVCSDESPVNPKSTWKSLLRSSHQWHRRVAHEHMLEVQARGESREWPSRVMEATIDGIHFEAVGNELGLAIHGYEMNHCAGTYADRCLTGMYRVYSAKSDFGCRGTLGINLSKNGRGETDQFRGRNNHALPAEFMSAGHAFLKLYNKAKLHPE